MSSSYVLTQKDLSHYRTQSIGKLAHKISSLYTQGISTCQMLCLTQEAIKYYFQSIQLRQEFEEELSQLNILKVQDIQTLAKQIQQKIQNSPLPDEIILPLVKAYNQIGQQHLVHLFLSPTDDLLHQSVLFKDTDTPVRAKGDANLLESVVFELSRYFSADAIAYRIRRNQTHFDYNIALNLQVIPDLEVSGVMETIETTSNKSDEIHIEAIWGLPDELLLGQVSPEVIVVKKHQWTVLHHHQVEQLYLRESNHPDKRKKILWSNKRHKPKLAEAEIEALAKIGHKIQQLFFYPQRIYWYKSDDQFYISRVEQLEAKIITDVPNDANFSTHQKLLGVGEGLSPGIKTGPIRILTSVSNADKVKSGEIVVVDTLSNELRKVFKSAQAIVAVSGGQTSHLGILAREVHIPVVVGVNDLYSQLKNGDVITVNGATGEIYSGGLNHLPKNTTSASDSVAIPTEIEKIHTKIFGYAPHLPPIKILQESLIQGILGVQASEILEVLQINPESDFSKINKKTVLNHLINYLTKVIEHAGDRQVFYRLHDNTFESNKNHTQYTGAVWLLDHPQWLLYESELLSQVWDNHKNLNLVLPGIRFHHEVLKLKKYLISHLSNPHLSQNLWVQISCANPLFEVEQIIKTGIEGLIIDLDGLSSQLPDINKLPNQDDFNLLKEAGLANALSMISAICKTTDTKLVIVSSRVMPTNLLTQLLENHLYAIASPPELVAMYIRELHGIEMHTLKRKIQHKTSNKQN